MTVKGICNEKKKGLKESLFERTFQVIKIGLDSSRVSHSSFEIFEFFLYVNNSTAYVTLDNDFSHLVPKIFWFLKNANEIPYDVIKPLIPEDIYENNR